MGLKRYAATRMVTMFGVLMITLLITIALVGSNMDTILKQGIVFQVRTEITETPAIAESFSSITEFESFIQSQIDQRIKVLGLDEPWYSPQRIGFTMYKILLLDNAPKKIPMMEIIIVAVVNSRTVLGSFSKIISLTSEEPESLVRNVA